MGYAATYPIIGDTDLTVAKFHAILPEQADDAAEADLPLTTGRNFGEVLRPLNSC